MRSAERILVDGHGAAGPQRLLVGHPPLAGKGREHVRQTVGDEWRGPIHHVEVEMRRVGVAAIAEQPEHLFNNCKALIAKINAAGGDATMLHPAELGIHGNSHMVMLDKNNLQIADLILKWIDENVGKNKFAKK